MKTRWLAGFIPLTLAHVVVAAPIRVGGFTGIGPGQFWHEAIHTASNVIENILANPNASNLGPNLVVPPDGFRYTKYGLISGSYTLPSIVELLAALDTLDVAVFILNQNIDSIFSDSVSRRRIKEFWKRKGVVSVHTTTDNRGRWPLWDSLHGTRFRNHPSAPDRRATIRMDTISRADPSWRLLNRSLSDTDFVEEWFYFRDSGTTIRATPGLKVTVNLDEATVSLNNPPVPMGDHPLSWYREFPEGGRFFYTAMGHRPNLWNTELYQPRFLRRQIYNAILWAAGVDSTGAVSVRNPQVTREGQRFADAARVFFSGGGLTVSVLKDGAHAIEIRGLDGRNVEARRGEGRAVHAFTGLRSGAVHVVSIKVGGQRLARLVTAP